MYVTNLPYVWSLARQTFRVLRSDEASTFPIEDKYARRSYARTKPGGGDTCGRVYGLDNVMERATGVALRSDSEENIIEMKAGLGTAEPYDYGKHPDGSQTVSWARSEGRTELNEALKGNFITKTTDVIIQNREK